ncbi:MAG: hypothetical protein LBU91_07705 [Bacteroidales bacterium]|jgi:hypothetical protein|nr:hypothetical protein [Bacteroidales bacterium]
MYRLVAILCAGLLLFSSCVKAKQESGYVRFEFEYRWGDELIQFDETTTYTNAAGNELMLKDLQYFISYLTIHGQAGSQVFNNPNIRYMSTDSAHSVMLMTHEVPAGSYHSVSFTFGLNAQDNRSNQFPNPPENMMTWPEPLGGGYHFLMLNGKWKNPGEPTDQGFGLHLGTLKRDTYDTTWTTGTISQQNDSIVKIDTITNVYDNSFDVSPIPKQFIVKSNEITTVRIIMDVKQWMGSRNKLDFNIIGGAIMENEEAMRQLAENGKYVFK